MLKEDGGMELFKVKDVMLIKKCKHLLGRLMIGGRIGIQIRSNIVHAQIFRGLEDSILETNIFHKPFWSEEICHEILLLGGNMNIAY